MRLHDVIVIGAGPAGAQCALWLKRLDIDVIVIESGLIGGLQRRSPYNNGWLSVVQSGTRARQIAKNIQENIDYYNIDVINTECKYFSLIEGERSFSVSTEDAVLYCRFLVLATGTTEETGGMQSREDFEFGIASLDTLRLRGQRVAILGGGDTACEAYEVAQESGATDVRVFARTVRARTALWNMVPVASKTVGPYSVVDDAIVGSTGPRWVFDRCLVCYGWRATIPPNSLIDYHSGAPFVPVNAEMETAVRDLFAIGDVNDRPYPCVTTAIADGVYAAKSIEKRIARIAS